MLAVNQLLIFGSGQVAEVFATYCGTVAGFVVDKEHRQSTYIDGVPVVAFEDVRSRFNPANHGFLIGMSFKGLNAPRAEKYQAMLDRGYQPIVSISPKASILKSEIGRGTMVLDENTIQPGAKIGENCVLWSGNHVGHHTHIGNHVWLSSGIVVSGACEVGDYTFIGSGATIADGVRIGKRCIIGAGSLVLKDVPDDSVVAAEGTPISKVRSNRAARLLG